MPRRPFGRLDPSGDPQPVPRRIYREDQYGATLDGDPYDPDNWSWQQGHPFGSGRRNSEPPTSYTVSATILRNVIPVVYADTDVGIEVTGLLGLAYRPTQGNGQHLILLAYVFSLGELAETPTFTFDGEAIADCPYIHDTAFFPGSATQVPWTEFTGFTQMADYEALTGMAYLGVLAHYEHMPNLPTVKALIKRGRIVTDFRDASTGPSANPALIAYDINVDSEIWMARPTAKFDTGLGKTWNEAADHFDEDVGSGEKRYHFNGAITTQDPEKAAEMVLGHAFSKVCHVEDRYYLRTRQCVTPRSDVEILSDHWIDRATVALIPKADRPNRVIVQYQTPDGKPGHAEPDYAAFVPAASEIQETISLSGCITQGMAKRVATKRLNMATLETIMLKGKVPSAVVADVIPGDIIPVSDTQGIFNAIPCWVEAMRNDGVETYIELLRYDDDTDSDVTAVDDDPLDPGPTGGVGAPSPPDSCTQEYIEVGPWEENTLLPDADDLTATGWVDGGGHVVAYDGGDDYSTLECDSATPVDFYAMVDVGTAAYLLLTFSIALHQAGDVTNSEVVRVKYQTQASVDPPSPWVTQFQRVVYPNESVGRFLRWGGMIPVVPADGHRIEFEVPALTGGATATAVRLKRCLCVPWASHPTARTVYDLIERWTWDEAADAEDTVKGYALKRKVFGSPSEWETLAVAPQGETMMETSVMPAVGGSGSGTLTWPTYLLAVGIDPGTTAEAPDPTQTFTGSLAPTQPTDIILTWYRSRDRKTTNSQDVGDWALGAEIDVTLDVEDSPDGTSTADSIEATAGGSGNDWRVYNEDNWEAWSWYTDPDGNHWQCVWARSLMGSDVVVAFGDALTPPLNLQKAVVHDYWTLIMQRSTVTDHPSDNGPRIWLLAEGDKIALGGAFLWPTYQDLNHKQWFEMTWTPAADADTIDGYALQIRFYYPATDTISGWVTHGVIPSGSADRISWGTSPQAMFGEFPATTDRQIYDWRLVAYRGLLYTELVPEQVDEVGKQEDVGMRNARDMDASTMAAGRLVVATGAEGFECIDPATLTGLPYIPLQAATDSGDPTGFVNPEDSGFIQVGSAVTRTFDLTNGGDPEDPPICYWIHGVRYEILAATQCTWTDTDGLWYVYLDAAGDLHSTQIWNDETLLRDNCIVAMFYWDATNKKVILLCDEMHGLMPWTVHRLWHSHIGSVLKGSGQYTIVGITADGNGSSDDHATFYHGGGTLIDEDLEHTSDGHLAPAQIKVLYRSGASGVWRMDNATGDAPIIVGAGGRGSYNEWTGATWQMTEVASTDFFLVHLFATNAGDDHLIAIPGQADYATLGVAQAGATAEMNDLITDGLPIAEFVPVATIIYETRSTYGNSWKSRIRSTAEGGDYIDWTTEKLGPGRSPADHAALTGRSNANQHPATAISLDTTNFDNNLSGTDNTVQAAMETLDELVAGASSVVVADIDSEASTDGQVITSNGDGTAEWRDAGGGAAPGYTATPFTAQTSVTVTHSYGSYPVVQVFDDTGAVIIPLSITHTSTNAFTVTFTASTTGTIVCTLGIGTENWRVFSCGRLSAVSGDPCPTADTASTTSVYLVPYRGDVLTLLDGSDDFEHLTFAETELALGTLTSGKLYTVYAYNNAGTLALEFSAAWTTDIAESEARETVKGLVVKASDHTRRIIGVIRTISTTETCDIGGGFESATVAALRSRRFVASLLNPLPRRIWCCQGYNNNNSTTTYTDASGSLTEPTFGGATHRMEYVLAEAVGRNVQLGCAYRCTLSSSNYSDSVFALGDDGAAAANVVAAIESYGGPPTTLATGYHVFNHNTAYLQKAVGYHFVTGLVTNANTNTIVVDARVWGFAYDMPLTFMHGFVLI